MKKKQKATLKTSPNFHSGDEEISLWLMENFPNSVHVPNNNGDQVVHFAAAEGKNIHYFSQTWSFLNAQLRYLSIALHFIEIRCIGNRIQVLTTY